ncbi:YjgB family protein [Niallia sp. 01092]|uniref:YjgB family protein n=1 Tax=unclassified Niallia TaxID=2837522 RepID=UPI003FD2524F
MMSGFKKGCKFTAVTVLIFGMLAACSSHSKSSESSAASHEQQESQTTNESSSSNNPAPSQSNNDRQGNGSDQSEQKGNGSISSTQSAKTEFIKHLYELAKNGQVPNCPFRAHYDLIDDDVEKAWGNPDRTDAVAKGLYATYSKQKVTVGFNKGSLIFDIRSYNPKLQTITYDQVVNTLGKPTKLLKNRNDNIYVYTVNKQFQLKFIIPSSTGKVDHISVYSPQDSINNMAE